MILTRLVDPGGGSSPLGRLVQRGVRLFRQVFKGDKKTPGAADQGLVRACPQPIAAAVGEPALAVVRRAAHEILSSYLARNRIRSMAAEMGRRYAFRLMSGPVGFGPGVGNRIAVYGFVGLSLANAVGRRDGQLQVEDGQAIEKIKELFCPKLHAQFVSKDVEEDTISVVEHESISADSDITILNDDDSDFEVLQSNEVFVIEAENDCFTKSDSIVCDEVMELQQLITLETKQQAEIHGLIQKLCQENEVLKDIISVQIAKENLLKTELASMLKSTDEQQKELLMLRDLVIRQNAALMTLYNQQKSTQSTPNPFKAAGENRLPNWTLTKDLVREKECRGCKDSDSLENYRERLRAAGGRVKRLKIHRKQRFKEN